MDEVESYEVEGVHYVRKTRVMRVDDVDDCPAIAFGMETFCGDQFLFTMADATAYDFMRRMSHILFDANVQPMQLDEGGKA